MDDKEEAHFTDAATIHFHIHFSCPAKRTRGDDTRRVSQTNMRWCAGWSKKQQMEDCTWVSQEFLILFSCTSVYYLFLLEERQYKSIKQNPKAASAFAPRLSHHNKNWKCKSVDRGFSLFLSDLFLSVKASPLRQFWSCQISLLLRWALVEFSGWKRL